MPSRGPPCCGISSVTMRATTATHAGCVQRGWVKQRPSQGAAAEMLLKMTHDPSYSS